jgi:xanthine dehydrogenase accessory factor
MKWPEEHILDLEKKRIEFALCTIVNTKGSAPRENGAKMIVLADGKISGTIGGGELEKQVIHDAIKTITEGSPRMFRYDLLHQLNMCCGGTVEVFIEPHLLKERLYIFGAGHVGQSLAHYAGRLNFETYLIDPRKEMFDNAPVENVSAMTLPYLQAADALPYDKSTYICIMTYSHPMDRDLLAYCLKKPHAYLGMIGSRRKTEITRKTFIQSGIAITEELDAVDMPMGIEIGAEGPEEIAVSIVAELVRRRNAGRNNAMKKQFEEMDESSGLRIAK